MKISSTVKKLFDCGKLPWEKKIFSITEQLTFLTAEKIIGLKILETNACVETIKTSSEAREET